MKRICLISLLLGMGVICAVSQDSIVSIPDTAFLYALIDEGVDTNGDSLISYAEAEAITKLDIDGYWGVFCGDIADLSGIEAFVNLDTLVIIRSSISKLDLSNNTALKYLSVKENVLTEINVSNCTELLTLKVGAGFAMCRQIQNLILQLDISNNSKLTQLSLNNIETLHEVCVWESFLSDSGNIDISTWNSPNVYFTTECLFDSIVSFPDTALLKALIEEGVDTNEDSLISYAECAVLTALDVSEKGISDMKGIEAFINLDTLFCGSNNIISLDVSNNTELTLLACSGNNLVSLDVSNNTALIRLGCSQNNLVSLDVSNNTALWGLLCWENEISTIDISNNLALELFWPAFNQLTSLDVSNNPALSNLNCSGNLLDSLDISANTALELLWCYDNQLTNLNLSNNTALKDLGIGDMPTLIEVCVWEMPFPPSGVFVDTKGSPNICYTTDCGSCSAGIGGNSQSGFSMYPNPTNDLLTIETEFPDHYSIEITTLNGQLIRNEEMIGTSLQIDLSSFQKGVYFITIRSKDFVTTRKIIKL